MNEPLRFNDRLEIRLKLIMESHTAEVLGGQVESVSLWLEPYGFSGEISFWIDDDEGKGGGNKDPLNDWFAEPQLMEMELELGPGRVGPYAPDTIENLCLAGIVRERRQRELAFDTLRDAAILRRHYTVTFADPARVLWTQHFPYALYTQSSIQEIFNDQKGDRIDIDYQWPPGGEPRPLTFLGLDGVGCRASFYDFAFWLFEGSGARFTFDYTRGGYALALDKPVVDSPALLRPEWVGRLEHFLPEVPRCATRTRNSYTGGAVSEEQSTPWSEAGVTREVLLRTPIRDEAAGVLEREAKRVRASLGLLIVDLAMFPDEPFAPGCGFRMDAKHRWGARSRVEDTEWRVRRVELHATAGDLEGASNASPSANHFKCEMSIALERPEEETDGMPSFEVPEYPHLVEGVVVSELGPEPDETYQTFEDHDTSQLRYRVKIPLFDDQVIRVPFDPCFSSGHYYTPAYRDERVLMAIGFDRAEVHRFLDWRDGIREEKDQLNRIQLGKAPDNRACITQYYDGEDPVLSIERQHARDTATIEMKEGMLRIEVREQGA